MYLESDDITAINGYASKNGYKLFRRMFSKMDMLKDGVAVFTDVKSKMDLLTRNFAGGIKPYTGKFVPGPGASYDKRQVLPEDWQRDIFHKNNTYDATLLEGEIAPGSSPAPQARPFAQEYTEDMMDSISQEFRLEVFYNGLGTAAFAAYNALSTYSVGALIKYTVAASSESLSELRYFICTANTSAGQNPETHPAKWQDISARAITTGLKKKLADAITAGYLSPEATGASSSTTAKDILEAVYFSKIPAKYRNTETWAYMSWNFYKNLCDDTENTVSKNFKETDSVEFVAKTNKKCLVKPVDWITGDGLIICRPNSLVVATDLMSDFNKMQMYAVPYGAQIAISGKFDVNFVNNECFAVNDMHV